jgi:hypothetical protein
MKRLLAHTCLVIIFCFGCKSKNAVNVYGIWKSNANSTLEISEYGKGVKVVYSQSNGQFQTFTGTLQDEVLTINSETGNSVIPINEKNLIFNGDEYSKVADADAISKCNSLDQLSKRIILAIRHKIPQILRTVYPDAKLYEAIQSKCDGGQHIQVSADADYLKAVQELEEQLTNYHMNYGGITFENFDTDPIKQLKLNAFSLTCKGLFKEIGQLHVTCKIDGNGTYLFVPCYLVAENGDVYLIGSVQISAS